MAETDTPEGSTNVIKISEEIEGDQIGTKNYRFSKIGETVPIKSDADFKFDMDCLPSCPLAVSERFGVIFVAHSTGFCVARIKDVMDTAEELKNLGKGISIQERSVVDVPLGKVSILALSADSSMLAASVGLNLYFLSVDGLLNKEHEPSFSKSLSGSSCIKDMQWSPHLKNQYVILTSDGNLYCGAGQDDLNNLMDSVDAVNWSRTGKYIAVAKHDYLSILSSKFEEKLRIKLTFDSLVDDSNDCIIKVDSVRWVRPDCIVLGCYQLSADGKEETYLVQLINVKDGKLTNPSSNPVAVTFSDAFLAINDDDIPFGSGPYMFVSYLDECELAFVANRKNTNQHIVLFGWSSDKKDGAEMIEITNDAWVPTIDLQDNSDDNLILGLAVDKVYKDEKIRFVLGEEDTEVSPCCILMCLTVDGKLFMFHFASATGPSVLPEDVESVSDEEEESLPLSSQHRVMSNDEKQPSVLPEDEDSVSDEEEEEEEESVSLSSQDRVTNHFNDEKQIGDQNLKELHLEKAGYEAHMRSEEEQMKSTQFSQVFKGGTQHDVPVARFNNIRDQERSLPPQKQLDDFDAGPFKTSEIVISGDMAKGVKSFENQEVAGVNLIADSLSKSANDKLNKTLSGEGFRESTEISDNKGSIGLHGSSGSFSSGSVFSSNLFGVQSSSSPHIKSTADSISKSANDKSNKTLLGEGFRECIELQVNKGSIGLPGSAGSFSSGSTFSSNLFGVQSSSSHSVVQGSADLSGKIGSTNLPVSSGSFSSGGMFSSRNVDMKSPLSPHTVIQGNQRDTSVGATHFSSGPQKISFPKMTSGQSTSSNLLGQGASTRAGVTNSLPVVSNTQSSLGKSSDFKVSDKGNLRNHTPSRLLNSEPYLSEQRSVEEMAKELDSLLDTIEGPGGFYDASVAAHKPSVAALEEGIWVLSDRCRKWTDTMDRGIGEVQLLFDKTVQVMTRKIYMEAIVKQATDSQYLDIWNRQKLSSELEMKRRHILEINQNLTNQLIELERHLNTLELQRFGNKDDVQRNHRSFNTKHGPPRHIQSLHSLHNTMNAQLAAAEKLSDCLSKQMAVLSIDTEPVKKQSVKKELFDTIGISYDGTTFSSPGQEKTREIPSKSKVLISSHSATANTDLKKSQLGALKSFEPETARRRRDSLDRSWASIEPPKTTVKRMLLQEDHQMSPGRLSLPTSTQKVNMRLSEVSAVSRDIPHGALNMSQIRGSQDAQIKRYSEGQLNNSRPDPLRTPVTSVLSLGSGSQSTPIVSRDAPRDSHDLAAEKSRNRLTFTLKSNDPKFNQQSQSSLEPTSNTTRPLATNIFQKKPIESSESSSKDTVRSSFAIGDGNQKSIVNESSSIWSRKNPESLFSAVSSASSATAFSGKSFSLEASKRESQPGQTVSSSIASSPVPVTSSAPPSFVFKNISSSSTSATSLGFGFKLSDTQTVPLSGSSASFSSFSSTPTFGTPKEPTTSSNFKPSVNIELNTSNSELSKLKPNTSESYMPHVVSVPKFESKPDEKSSAQTSPLQPAVSSGALSLNLGLSVPSGPKSEPSTSSFSTSSPALVSNSKPEQPLVTPAISTPAVSNPVDGAGRAEGNSDVTLTQEDEMEEEAPDTAQLSLGNLGGFGLGSAPNPSAPPKQNPFGASFGNPAANTPISFSAAPSTGGLFRPASFNVESSQPSQPSQQTNFGAFSGGFGGNNNSSNAGQGFGQPARIGSGQQALGSVLGSFGQSRQFGAGLPGSVASPNLFGSGFGGNQAAGGFATASAGGGFANLASGGGGFGSLATGGGGFAAAATGGGGFASAATGTGGFGAAPAAGGGFAATATGGGGFASAATGTGGFGVAPAAAAGGFAGAASGGFGGFSSQGGSAFSTFGSTGGTGRPPSELFTQMRK